MKKRINFLLLACLFMINVTQISAEDKLPFVSFPVQYTPSPEFVYNINIIYSDNANSERIPDGTEISLYWENTSGELFYVDTFFIDNSDPFYNIKTKTNIYDKGDIKRFHFYLESDLENRPIRVPSAGSNPGQVRTTLFANGGLFSNGTDRVSTLFYNGGTVTMFNDYEVPTREGYIFKGWVRTNFDGAATQEPWDIDNHLVYGPTFYLKAQWQDMKSVLTVKHLDTEGNSIVDDVVIDGMIGEPYETSPVDLSAYRLVETPDNASGTFTENEHEVIYTYAKRAVSTITVQFLDEDRVELRESKLITGTLGEAYAIVAPLFEKWNLKTIEGLTEGLFDYEDKLITFIYSPVTEIDDEEEKPEIKDPDDNEDPEIKVPEEEKPTKEDIEKNPTDKTPHTGLSNISLQYANTLLISMLLMINFRKKTFHE